MRYLDDGDVVLHHGDVLEVLAGLPSESVDSCVTSPPYFGLRDYGTGRWEGGDEGCVHRVGDRVSDSKAPGAITTGVRPGVDASRCRNCGATRIDQQIGLEDTPEAYITRLVGVFQQVRRVLAPHGTCFVNMGDSYAGSWGNQGRKAERGTQRPINGGMLTPVHDGRYPSNGSNTGAVPDGVKPKDLLMMPARLALALQADGWWIRSEVVWVKPNAMPESVRDRPTSAHEKVYLLTKAPRYYWDAEAVREPDGGTDHRRNVVEPVHDHTPGSGPHNGIRTAEGRNGTGRNMRNVWTIATEPTPDAHFATFPTELVRRCLAAGCPEGGTVLDPFVGSGTTCLVARRMGLRSIGIDLNADYLAIAARKTQQLSLLGDAA